jgi:hypothetical protein
MNNKSIEHNLFHHRINLLNHLYIFTSIFFLVFIISIYYLPLKIKKIIL